MLGYEPEEQVGYEEEDTPSFNLDFNLRKVRTPLFKVGDYV